VRKVPFVILALAISALAQSTAKKATPPAPAPATRSAGTTKPGNLPSEETVNEFLRHTFGYEQNLKYKVAEIKPAADPSMAEVTVVLNTPEGQQALKLFITPDQKYALSGEFVPFGADPYLSARQTLQQKAKGPARGPANAPVTIVEFGDLQCPACKKAQPTIEKLLTDVPNARLIFQQFPLVQLHKWANVAAKYGLCVAKQNNDAYWKFIDTVYQHQDELQSQTEEQVAPKLKEYAGYAGVNTDQVQQCTNDPAIVVAINDSLELGREMEVTGTPTLFIGGRKIGNVGGIPYETLKAITEFQGSSK
jgi:protein-disulfide isomerase